MRQMVRLLLLTLMCSMILFGCGGSGGSSDSETFGYIIGSLAVQPGNSSIVFAATGPGNNSVPYRFYKSNDGGAHWRRINALSGYEIKCIAFDPSNPSTIYVGSDFSNDGINGTIFRSTDNGATWTKIYNFMVYYDDNMKIIVDPKNSSNIAYIDWQQFLRSTDGGQTWTEREFHFQINDLVSVPNSSTLYISSSQYGLEKSDDFGATWVQVNPASIGDNGLVVNPQNPLEIYAAIRSEGVAKSSDGGVQWNNIFKDSITLQILVDPTNPSNLYVRCFTGIYKSADAGGTWKKITKVNSYATGSYMTIDPNDGSVLLGVGNYGILKSRDGGETWAQYIDGGLAH